MTNDQPPLNTVNHMHEYGYKVTAFNSNYTPSSLLSQHYWCYTHYRVLLFHVA